MRVSIRLWALCLLLLGLNLNQFAALASDTFVFQANSSLKGAAMMDDGSVHQLRLKSDSDLLLGDLAGSSLLAIAVEDTECQMMGLQPTVRIVAFQNGSIVASLVNFTGLAPIFIGDSKVIYQARGSGYTGVEGASLDAVITVNYDSCSAMNVPTTPTQVSIEPLGLFRPTGVTGPAGAPLLGDSGTLQISGSGLSTSPTTIPLHGTPTTAVADCSLQVNLQTLSFGNVSIGSNSQLSVQVRNNGGTACTVSNGFLAGSAAFSPATVGSFTLNPGASTNLDFTFTPFATGTETAILTLTGSDPSTAQRFVTLTGNGTAASLECNLSASPLALNFGAVEIGASTSLAVTVHNNGGFECLIDKITLVNATAEFSVTPPASSNIAAGASGTITVTFTPSDVTGERAFLEIDSAGTNGSNTNLTIVTLTATGVVAQARLDIEPRELDFGAVAIGTNRSEIVTITNTGITNATISSLSINNSEFALAGAPVPPFIIEPGSNVVLTVDYAPSAQGATNGTLSIVSENPLRTNTVSLTGFGVLPVTDCTVISSRPSFDFGDATVGTTNVIKATISNVGMASCTIHSISLTGSNTLTLISPPAPFELPPNSTFEVGIRFRPNAVGDSAGTLQIVSSDEINTVEEFPVTGTGVLVRCVLLVEPASVDFGSLDVGSNASDTVRLSNTNAINCSVRSISIVGGSGAFTLSPSVPTTRFTLRPDEFIDVPVLFTALNQGTNNATLRIDSDDSVNPILVPLAGLGLRCALTVSPTSLREFGTVTLGTTNTLTVTISNTGNIDCSVDDVEVVGSGRFFVVTPLSTIAPGQQVPVSIEYRPRRIQTVVIQGGKIRSSGKQLAP